MALKPTYENMHTFLPAKLTYTFDESPDSDQTHGLVKSVPEKARIMPFREYTLAYEWHPQAYK
jgi:hypothetical protein